MEDESKKSLDLQKEIEAKKELEEEKEEKRIKLSLDFYIIFSILCVILYTIVSVILVAKTGMSLDSSLTTCVFAFFGGEVFSCAMIKRFKLKEEKSKGGIG